MTAFMIGTQDEERLKTAVANALTKPIPWEVLKKSMPIENQQTDTLTLKDRQGYPPVQRDVEEVILPLGWRVAITCEEQPAGKILHLSMSSPKKGRIPSEAAMKLVIEACGYSMDNIARGWLEEFEPGHNAINVLIMIEPIPSERL
jgi:hypothetical protein